MAVDQKSNKHKQAYATVALDLASEEAVKFLLSLLKQPGRVFYVPAAPPCGTCSRARERRLKRAVRRLGVKEPSIALPFAECTIPTWSTYIARH